MASARERKQSGFSVRALLLLLICALVAPVLLVQAWLYRQQYHLRDEAELQANLEMARAVAASFSTFVNDLRQEESAVGHALLLLSPFVQSRADDYLTAVERLHPELRCVSWVGPDGRVLASSSSARMGEDWRDRPWWQAIRGGKQWVLSDVSRPARMRDALFEAVASARDRAGRWRGAVVAEVAPNQLEHAINIKRSGAAAVSLVDSSGWLAFRRPALELTYEERNWGELYPRSVARALAGHEAKAVEYASYQKGRRIRGSVPVPGTRWVANAGRPESEAMAPVTADIAKSAALLVAVLLGGLVVAVFAARAITRPLIRLRQHALAFGRGELDRRAAVEGPSDLAGLSSAFNDMADDLQRRQRDQEQAARALERERQRLELLAGTAAHLLTTSDPVGAVNDLAHRTMTFLDCEVFFNFLVDEREGRLRLNAYAGIPETTAREIEWLDYGVAVSGCTALEGRRIVAEHIPTTEDPRTDLVKGFGVKAYACHPIKQGKKVLGTLSFGSTTRETFTEDELAVMAAVTDQVTLAVVRKQTEEALRESERREHARSEELLKVLDAVPAAVWIAHDPQALDITGNHLSYEWVKLPPGANPSKSLPEGERPETFQVFKDGAEVPPEQMPVQLSAAGTEVRDYEFDLVYPDGDVRHVLGNATPLRDEQGRPRGSVSAFIDITARKQAEDSLRRQAELIDLSPDAIIIKRADGTITFWSKGAEALYGWTSAEVVGRTTQDILRSELSEPVEQVNRQLRDTSRWSGEVVHHTRDGRRVTVQSRWLARFDERGNIREILESNVDITARKQAEDALLEAERAQTRSAQALTSEIAHRTKNNLAIVAGLLQLQLDRKGAPDAHADLIRDAVTRIMSFAALHEQMYNRHSDSIELLDALQHIADVDRQVLSAVEAVISVEGEPAEYPSQVAANLCVVANELVTNAVKHGATPEGTSHVEIRLSREAGKLVLNVWNSYNSVGADFDVEARSKTGLGLVHAIVEDQYGGAFTLRPERGGTLARVVLDEEQLRKR